MQCLSLSLFALLRRLAKWYLEYPQKKITKPKYSRIIITTNTNIKRIIAMKILLIIAVIAAIVAITAIKENKAEAFFQGLMFCFTIAICSIFIWITGKLRQRNLRRMREDHEIIWSKNNRGEHVEIWVDEVSVNAVESN
jgi:hypothetical protein